MKEKIKEILPQTFIVQEIAKHLKVTEITIYRLLKKGDKDYATKARAFVWGFR